MASIVLSVRVVRGEVVALFTEMEVRDMLVRLETLLEAIVYSSTSVNQFYRLTGKRRPLHTRTTWIC